MSSQDTLDWTSTPVVRGLFSERGVSVPQAARNIARTTPSCFVFIM
jgi:hypothetical protein